MNELENRQTSLALISLGSNINPEKFILAAIQQLAKVDDRILVSTIWESPAVGSSGPNYLNAAALLNTQLPEERIKPQLLSPIEERLGRVKTDDKFADRTIDLDVLIYENTIIDPELWHLAHLAIPASELMPNLRNPNTGEDLEDVAIRLRATAGIIPRLDLY